MPGIGPITNTRTLKGALSETIEQLERARKKPTIVRMLSRCREYRRLVDEWDAVSPPPDEQFETIGQIMQLLGAAMHEARGAAKEDPEIQIHALEPLGHAFDEGDDLGDVVQHELELELVPASPCAQVVELYREPWRQSSKGIFVKTLSNARGRHHALVRLESGAELPGQRHDDEELIYVMEGCIRHAGSRAHAGACLRIEGDSTSGPIQAVGEATLLLIDSVRRAIKF